MFSFATNTITTFVHDEINQKLFDVTHLVYIKWHARFLLYVIMCKILKSRYTGNPQEEFAGAECKYRNGFVPVRQLKTYSHITHMHTMSIDYTSETKPTRELLY